jgi:regulator of protease activity HflC (stomatin/prohibitin superfamily)
MKTKNQNSFRSSVPTQSRPVPRRGNANVAGLGALIIIGVLVMVAMSAVRTVDTGYIGVKTRFGKIVSDSLPAGLYFVIPGVEDIAQVEVREQKTEMSTSASSKDLQSIQSGIAINFRPDPANAHLLFKDVGTEYEARILDPAIEETVKAATARYTAEELITKRTAVRDEMETMLKDRVEGNHIMITKFNIVNFEFSDSFNHAIEEKQTAEQEALRATNILRRMKVEADQKIETARGAAESVKLQAAAEAEAITMKAIAEAEAQRILAEVVNRDVITLRAIEKWDGIMPKVTGETVPFISVDAKTVGGK